LKITENLSANIEEQALIDDCLEGDELAALGLDSNEITDSGRFTENKDIVTCAQKSYTSSLSLCRDQAKEGKSSYPV